MKKPLIRVDYDPDDTVVYIRKHNGNYVAVYLSSAYDGGFVINEDLSPHAPKAYGKKVWQA